MTDEEAKYAFNSNMMATGLLSEYPAEFAKQNGRRWLVSSYEAGDVVLHKPHAVCPPFHQLAVCSVFSVSLISRSTHRPSTTTRTMLSGWPQTSVSVIPQSRMTG